jgi:hypothetical protein
MIFRLPMTRRRLGRGGAGCPVAPAAFSQTCQLRRSHPHSTRPKNTPGKLRIHRVRGEVNLLVTKSSDFSGSPERPGPGTTYSLHTRRLTQREQHRSYHSNMIGVVAKTTNSNVFSALPFDPASGVGLRQLSHPSQHFLFGCLTSPMQSLTASYNSPLNNLWVCGSKEDGPPNHPISPVDHCGPPIGKSANSPAGR